MGKRERKRQRVTLANFYAGTTADWIGLDALESRQLFDLAKRSSKPSTSHWTKASVAGAQKELRLIAWHDYGIETGMVTATFHVRGTDWIVRISDHWSDANVRPVPQRWRIGPVKCNWWRINEPQRILSHWKGVDLVLAAGVIRLKDMTRISSGRLRSLIKRHPNSF